MKKSLHLIVAMALAFSTMEIKAQLPDGSTAPDWTFADLNSVSHNLYTYLDAGKTVFIDVSATWCAPCWSYHTSGALNNLYNQYGPSGTNELMVFFIEGDGATGLNCLQGNTATCPTTKGDWITGTLYPIINPSSAATTTFNNAYSIAYFPTVYMICPNRIITEVGQGTTAQLYAAKANCPPPASVANDPALLSYTGTTSTCGNVDIKVLLQNNGTSPLTACTITAMNGATQVAQINWTGNIATYATQDVLVGSTSISANTTFSISITSADNNTANNSVTKTVAYALTGASSTITVNITTDAYGTETTWAIFNSASTVVGQGGPYNDLGASGTTVQTPVNFTLPNDCYKMEVYDSYGDGMNSGYGIGSWNVKSNSVTIASGGTFTTQQDKPFQILGTSVEDIDISNYVSIFPNPSSGNVFVNISSANLGSVNVKIFNVIGEVIAEKNAVSARELKFDLSKQSNGMYFVEVKSANGSMTQKVMLNK